MIKNNNHKLLFILAFLQINCSYAIDFNKQSHNIKTLIYQTYQQIIQSKTPDISVKNLAQEKGNFPADFNFSISTSSTQNEENSNNNTWSPSYIKNTTGKKHLETPEFACKSWKHWQDDIDKVIHLGCNSYRFSIEWSRIQPTADSFDKAAIAHYVAMAQYCQKHHIKVTICLHHYSDPVWFMEQGGFAEEQNLQHFETYCQKMYEALRPYVGQWIVISQPVAYAVKGYKAGMMPPFLTNSGLENKVMLNMFKAHMHVYDIMHDTYNQTKIGQKPQIGICHQIVQMQPTNWINPFDQLVANFADRLYNKTLLRFFTDGHFRSLTPKIDIGYELQAPQKFDFFALSYYSPLAFNGTKTNAPTCSPECACPDNFRIIDKQGMYDAIVQASKLGKPIYIVENGITTTNEDQRKLLLNSYLSAISQAISDGYDVRGYSYWTLMNDYEWMNVKLGEDEIPCMSEFGLYKNRVINKTTGELDPNFKKHDLMLKEGGQHYKNIITFQKKKKS